MDKCWFVLTDDTKQEGPFTEDEVVGKIQSGSNRAAKQVLERGIFRVAQVAGRRTFHGSSRSAGGGAQEGAVQEMLSKGWSALRSTLAAGKESAAKMAHAAKLKMRLSKTKKDRDEALRSLGQTVYDRRTDTAIAEPSRRRFSS